MVFCFPVRVSKIRNNRKNFLAYPIQIIYLLLLPLLFLYDVHNVRCCCRLSSYFFFCCLSDRGIPAAIALFMTKKKKWTTAQLNQNQNERKRERKRENGQGITQKMAKKTGKREKTRCNFKERKNWSWANNANSSFLLNRDI